MKKNFYRDFIWDQIRNKSFDFYMCNDDTLYKPDQCKHENLLG